MAFQINGEKHKLFIVFSQLIIWKKFKVHHTISTKINLIWIKELKRVKHLKYR